MGNCTKRAQLDIPAGVVNVDPDAQSAPPKTIRASRRCVCAVVGRKALEGLLEASREMGHGARAGEGVYRDEHPWIVAREILHEATGAGERLPVMFAVDEPLAFSHWAFVRWIDVQELHRGAWETRCGFDPLAPVNPIWATLDSVALAPSREQLHREAVEPIRQHRQLLAASLIHPYAVCETPPFILQENAPPLTAGDAP